MTTVAIVQARMGSSRLPGKVLATIEGRPAIDILLERLSRASTLDSMVLATTDRATDDVLARHVEELGYAVHRGDEHDVLRRFAAAAEGASASVIVRITGDCPLVDPTIVDDVVRAFRNAGVDYASNTSPPTFPDGLDVEVFSRSALDEADRAAIDHHDREHVTPYLRSTRFTQVNYENESDHSGLRWTLDEPADLELLRRIFARFGSDAGAGWKQVLEYVSATPELRAINDQHQRNEGVSSSSGQKLWRRAKGVIPGGNMLLSKRPDMFLPDEWPAYFSKAKGITVWDLDDRAYLDLSLMGVGTNILGYGDEAVDSAVRAVIDSGNMSTLNAPEEVALAERLVELHPWSDMVRFARSGGEANAMAIRIARAASGRDKVAICGYHGWHDWYLSTNLGDTEKLAGHLLPGLEVAGVPQELRGTVLPFQYNDIDGLFETLEANPDIGVIKMEVVRNQGPIDGFLEKVRAEATRRGIVLIFDECTSGFRETYGGIHLKYGVEPDVAVFGKTLGNGYAVSATIGRRSVMEAAQSTFISSTFWTERIGSAAGLKTLEVMERRQPWPDMTERGEQVRAGWSALAADSGMEISITGIPALSGFAFASSRSQEYKTYIAQQMLKNGYLASTALYVCALHTEEVVDRYLDQLGPIFAQIGDADRTGRELLKGPVAHSGFKRLN